MTNEIKFRTESKQRLLLLAAAVATAVKVRYFGERKSMEIDMCIKINVMFNKNV